jgi:glycosyltransferase involved in cell wall biosynthesis
MKALYCTDTYPPQVNGVSVVTALSVAGLVARGWDVHVIAPKYPAGPSDHVFAGNGGETITTIPSAPLPMYPDIRMALPNARLITRTIAEFQPDIVHCATEFVIGRLGQRAALALNIPVATSYHTDFGKYTEAYGVPWLRPSVSRYLFHFHGRARRTYTPGGPARDELVQNDVVDVEVWGRGVDTQMFHPDKRDSEYRRALGVDDKFVFLHVGRLAAEKGAHLILEAYAKARAQLPPDSTCLIIAGEGPARPELERNAGPGVQFLGYLQRATELPRLYASADAFLFASTTETLGLVVLESMSAGVPVIAAPEGGVRDHLRHEENGLSYPAYDTDAMAQQMVRMATDASLRERLVVEARRTGERLTWEMELDRLNQSYLEIVRGARE